MANRKLRSATETQKISKSKPNISATCLNDNKSPVFSFAHVTSNKNYCFDFLNFQPQNIALKKDEKIFVFRFGKGDAYRLMGFKKECNCTLYIIGYDFDHSAYDH